MMDNWKKAAIAIAAIIVSAIIFFFAAWLMGLVIHAYCTVYMTGDLPAWVVNAVLLGR